VNLCNFSSKNPHFFFLHATRANAHQSSKILPHSPSFQKENPLQGSLFSPERRGQDLLSQERRVPKGIPSSRKRIHLWILPLPEREELFMALLSLAERSLYFNKLPLRDGAREQQLPSLFSHCSQSSSPMSTTQCQLHRPGPPLHHTTRYMAPRQPSGAQEPPLHQHTAKCMAPRQLLVQEYSIKHCFIPEHTIQATVSCSASLVALPYRWKGLTTKPSMPARAKGVSNWVHQFALIQARGYSGTVNSGTA
jgi:hypothetical protein